MKPTNNKPYKVELSDIMQRYSVSEDLKDEIQKRVNRINRSKSIPRSVLDRRSSDLQNAYIKVKELDTKTIKRLEKAFDNLKQVRKEVSIKWESGKLNKAESKVEYALNKAKLHYCSYEALMAVILGYKFY